MQMDLDFGGDLEALQSALADFEDALVEELSAAVDRIMAEITRASKRNAPVDTGRLRNSIESVVEQTAEAILEGTVGSDVPYAIIQEIEQPYVRPAIERNRDTIYRETERAVQSAWEAVQ